MRGGEITLDYLDAHINGAVDSALDGVDLSGVIANTQALNILDVRVTQHDTILISYDSDFNKNSDEIFSLSGRITTVEQDLTNKIDSATLVNTTDELRSEIRSDSEINVLINTKITEFNQSLDLVNDSDITSAINSASDILRSELLNSDEVTTIVNTKITEFSSGSLIMKMVGVAASLVNSVKDELLSEIRTDSEVNALINAKITEFNQSLDLVSDSDIISAVNSASDTLRSELINSDEATTIVNTKITEFSGTLTYEQEGVVATLVSDAKDELRSEIRTDSEVNALIDSKITAFNQSLDLVTDSDITSATNSVKDELIAQLIDSVESNYNHQYKDYRIFWNFKL